MPEVALCKICGKRRARRNCPAVSGDICTICCGTEREVSLNCPLECVWLQEAHRHEKPVPVPEDQISNPDIEITERFMAEHEELLFALIHALVDAAVETPGAVDSDVVSALVALIQTHRTLESGLMYETKPDNRIAASVQRLFSESFAEYQKMRQERQAFSGFRNAEILAVLVFLHRIGQQSQNGRPRGRMFIDWLRGMLPGKRVEEHAPSIIL